MVRDLSKAKTALQQGVGHQLILSSDSQRIYGKKTSFICLSVSVQSIRGFLLEELDRAALGKTENAIVLLDIFYSQ